MNGWDKERGNSLLLQLPVRNKKLHGITLGTERPLTRGRIVQKGQAAFSQQEAGRQIHPVFWAPGEQRLSEDHMYCGLVLLGRFHGWWSFHYQAEPWPQEAAAV